MMAGTIEWAGHPVVIGDERVFRSVCRRAMIVQTPSPLPGESDMFTVSITAEPDRVHPTMSSMFEAIAYVQEQLEPS